MYWLHVYTSLDHICFSRQYITMQHKQYAEVINRIKQSRKPFNRYMTGVLFLTWGVIGAGFFALPQAMLRVGIIPAIIIMTLVGILVVIMHLLLAEVSLSLPGHATIVGMGRQLFPRWLARMSAAVSIGNFFLGILIYVVISWAFIQTLVGSFGLAINHVRATTIYVVVIAASTLWGFKSSTRIDKVIVCTLLGVFLMIALYALGRGDMIPQTSQLMPLSPRMLYSICLLSFLGVSAVPLLNHITKHRPEQTASIITSSGMLVTVTAILFSLAIISLSGNGTTDDVARGLLHTHGPILWAIASITGLCAILSSHIPVMNHLTEIFVGDGHTTRIRARRALVALPFLIYLYFDPSFITLLGVVGGLLSGLMAMLVCLMNIRLHTTKQKLHIIRVLPNDQMRSRIVFVVCGVGVLYHILTIIF